MSEKKMVSVNESRFNCPRCGANVAESYRSEHYAEECIDASPATAAEPETCPKCDSIQKDVRLIIGIERNDRSEFVDCDDPWHSSPAAPAETPRCRYPGCPTPTWKYAMCHQVNDTGVSIINHPWQPAVSTEAKPFASEQEAKKKEIISLYDWSHLAPAAQPGEDARRAEKVIRDRFLPYSSGASMPMILIIQEAIDSATRELKAENDKKDFALDQADKNLKLLYSEVAQLTAELAALRERATTKC